MIIFQTFLSLFVIVLNVRVCLWLMGRFAEPAFLEEKQEWVAWTVSLIAGCLYALMDWGEESDFFDGILALILIGLVVFVARRMFCEHRWMAVFVGLNYLFVSDLLEMLAKGIAKVSGGNAIDVESLRNGIVFGEYWDTKTVLLTAVFKIVLFVICILIFRGKHGNHGERSEEVENGRFCLGHKIKKPTNEGFGLQHKTEESTDGRFDLKQKIFHVMQENNTDNHDTANRKTGHVEKASAKKVGKKLFWWIGFLLCITESVSEYVLANALASDGTLPAKSIFAIMLYLMVILLILLMGGMAYLYFEKKRSLDFQSRMLANLNAEYQAVTRLYRERETMYHDFKNHLLVLEDHLKNHRLEECISYMERIQEPFFEKTTAYKTGHAVLDLVTGAKMREAREQGIEVREEMQGRIDFSLKLADEEVCALLGSLWDNAIEACAKLEKERRWIAYKLKIEQNLMMIVMANPCDGILVDEDGELVTTKESGIHGVGWRHVNLIVEAHQGHLEYGVGDGIFKVEIMFYHE